MFLSCSKNLIGVVFATSSIPLLGIDGVIKFNIILSGDRILLTTMVPDEISIGQFDFFCKKISTIFSDYNHANTSLLRIEKHETI